MKQINHIIIAFLLLFTACENIGERKETEKVLVKIQEGTYESMEANNNEDKTKAGQLLAGALELLDDQLNLADKISIRNETITSNTATGQKEIKLTRSNTSDSLFFGDLPTTGGNIKEIEIRVTKENHLRINTGSKMREYKMIE